jgi:hypothetical protein
MFSLQFLPSKSQLVSLIMLYYNTVKAYLIITVVYLTTLLVFQAT